MEQNPSEDAKHVSKSTRVKARKPGDKLYRPFGYDDPGASLQGLIEHHGAVNIARMFSRLTGWSVLMNKPSKTDRKKE